MSYSKHLSLLTLSIAILSLAGCVTPEQRLDMAKSQCQSFGFAPGTANYAQCIQKQHNEMVKNELKEDSNFQQRRIAESMQR